MGSNGNLDSNSTSEKGISSSGVILLYWRTKEETIAAFASLVAFICFLIVSGLAINTFVCYVMIRSKRLQRNLSNMFIFHLSFTDLVFRVLVAPLELYSAFPSTTDASALCKFSTFISATCSTAVFMSLVVIAVDRYFNIVHPLKSRKDKTKPAIVVLVVWMYSMVSSMPFLFTARSRYYTELPEAQGLELRSLTCEGCSIPKMCDLPQDWSGQVSSTWYFVLAFLLPLGIMAVLYTKIVMSLWRRSRHGVAAKTAARSKGKAVRMLIAVLVGFAFTWGPGMLLSMMRSYGLFHESHFNVILITTMLTETTKYCSSLVNPLIYAFYNSTFRKDLVNVCCGGCTCTRNTAYNSSTEMKEIRRSREAGCSTRQEEGDS